MPRHRQDRRLGGARSAASDLVHASRLARTATRGTIRPVASGADGERCNFISGCRTMRAPRSTPARRSRLPPRTAPRLNYTPERESGTNRGRQTGTGDAVVEEGSRPRGSVAAIGVDRRGGGGYGVEGGLGVDPEAAEAGVAALGDQDRQLDALLGEVGEPGVAQLVKRPAAGGGVEDLGGAAVGQPGAPGVGVEVGERGLTCRRGAMSARNSGPLVRPCRWRGSSRAVFVSQPTSSARPPLPITTARRRGMSRSLTFSARISFARAAVSYSSHQSVFSRRGCCASRNAVSSSLGIARRRRWSSRLVCERRRSRPAAGGFACPALAGGVGEERAQRRDDAVP